MVDPGLVHAKVIGLLGGMSWPSTLTYYRDLNKAVQARLGGSHSARVLIWSDDYHAIERMQLAGDWVAAGDSLARAATRLEAAGAELLGIACNTMHRVSAAVRARTATPLVDLVDATADAAAALSIVRPALLGTRFTAEMGMFQGKFGVRGISSVLPSPKDQQLLDQIIYGELCVGVVTERSRKTLTTLMTKVLEDGADAIVLACTELNLLMDARQVHAAPVLDTTRVHVEALVHASLGASKGH